MNSHQRALQIVRAVGEISFVGNVIPHSWYRHLVRPNGKPYVVAIILLAEVVYWYRPELVKDEASGRLVGIRKKFQGDKYRTSYPDLAERFGFGRDQVIDAVEYLETFGVLTKEVRERVVVYGQLKGNVLFLEPVPTVLERISALPDEDAESDGPLPEISRKGLPDDPVQPSLFGAQGQPTGNEVDGNAESAAPLPEESREGLPDAAEQGQPATDSTHRDAGSAGPLPEESREGSLAVAVQGQPAIELTHGNAESARPLPEESRDPYGIPTVTLTGGIPQGLRGESRDPYGRNPVSLKGTKIPSEIPAEIPPETPLHPSGAPAPAEEGAAAAAETRQALFAEGILALTEFADVPAAIIRAAALDTRLPQGHEARPAFIVKRLRAWRTHTWAPPANRARAPAAAPAPTDGVWAAVCARLRPQIPPGDFLTAVEASRLLLLDDAVAVISAPHVFARDGLQPYAELIMAALSDVTGTVRPIELVIGEADP
jgi:hypothetical protein